MNEILDLRVKKTYDRLITALFELLQKESLDKLTVNELCNEANISRPTFYKHFKDKYDFFQFALTTSQNQQITKIDEKAADKKPLDYFLTLFKTLIDSVEEYQNLLVHLQIDTSATFLFESAGQNLERKITKRWQQFIDKDEMIPSDIEFNVQILVGMFKQVGFWWLKNQKEVSKEEVLKKMARILILFFDMKNPTNTN